MPHDPNDTLRDAFAELERLRRENTELKVLLIDAVRQMKDVETTLLRALDKDR